MKKDYNIYFEGNLVTTGKGIDDRDALSHFMRNGGGGYPYVGLRAELVKDKKAKKTK